MSELARVLTISWASGSSLDPFTALGGEAFRPGSCEDLPRERRNWEALIVEVHRSDFSTAIEWLRQVDTSLVGAWRIIYAPDVTREQWLELLNLKWTWRVARDVAAIPELLASAREAAQRRRQLDSLRLEARSKNRRLEDVHAALEREVIDRTQREESSQRESLERMRRVRELLNFVQRLAEADSVASFLAVLRRELRSEHQLSEPVLAYQLGSQGPRLAYLRGGKMFERQAKATWSSSLRLRQNDREDSQYLANEFSRPYQKVLAIPLLARAGSRQQLAPTLFFEHQMSTASSEDFLQRTAERIQAASIALDRILLESELHEASSQWEKTFDGINDPIAIIDADWTALRANRHFQRSVGRTCHATFAGANQVCEGCPLAGTLQRGQSGQASIKIGERHYLVHSYPIRQSQDEQITAAVHHYVDITSDLAFQERMVQSEKMVALGHLAGHVAHELNNPLTGIRSLAQVVAGQPGVPQEVRSDLTEIEKAAGRCQAIIQNLLSFAKGEEGRARSCDLNDIVAQTLPLLKTAIGVHRHDVQYSEEKARVFVEPQLIQQVVFNLVKNACQAMPQPGQLDIRIEPSALRGAPAWQVLIRDTGVGLSEESLARLFTPFFTTKGEGEGTGLGLSLSQNVVKRFGGEIRVESRLGSGSTFMLVLPKDQGDV